MRLESAMAWQSKVVTRRLPSFCRDGSLFSKKIDKGEFKMKTTFKHLGTLLALCRIDRRCSAKPASEPSGQPDQDTTQKTVITIRASTSPHAEILEYAQPYF